MTINLSKEGVFPIIKDKDGNKIKDIATGLKVKVL